MSNLKCCPDPCVIPEACVNPLIHLLRRTISYTSDAVDFSIAFDEILSAGFKLTGAGSYCCPDCTGANSFYFLGAFSIFSQLMTYKEMSALNGVGAETDPLLVYPCCVNTSLTIADSDGYTSLFTIVDELNPAVYRVDKRPACCSNDFASVIDQMLEETAIDSAMLSGIVEGSSFNTGKSGIKIMLDYLKSLPVPISKADITSILSIILTKGLYIECDGCDIYVRTAVSYLV